jgi:hypothetical protein
MALRKPAVRTVRISVILEEHCQTPFGHEPHECGKLRQNVQNGTVSGTNVVEDEFQLCRGAGDVMMRLVILALLIIVVLGLPTLWLAWVRRKRK